MTLPDRTRQLEGDQPAPPPEPTQPEPFFDFATPPARKTADKSAGVSLITPTKDISPLRQELAIRHATWKYRSSGDYDSARSMAWATVMESAVAGNPELLEAFRGDFTTAIAAVEADKVLDRLPFVDASVTDRLMEASDEQIRLLSTHLRTARDLATQAHQYAETRSRVEAPGYGQATLPAQLEQGRQVPLSEAAARFEAFSPDRLQQLNLMGQGGLDPQALGVAGTFLERASGKTLTWFQTEGRLVADIDGHLYDLHLDGPVENTALGVIGAIVDSFYEQRHELLRADKLPGPQTFFGTALEFAGAITAPIFQLKDKVDAPLNWLLGDHTTEGFRTSETIVAQRLQAAIDRGVATRLNPDDVLIAGIALGGGPDRSFLATDPDAAALVASLPPIEQERLAEILGTAPSREQVEASLEELKDTRHSVRRVMDQTVEGVFNVFAGWEAFVQNNVIQTFNFLGDLGQGIVAAPGGWQKFRDAFEGVPAGVDNLADYWGISPTSGAYGAVNLFGSLAGDPFTYLGLSGPMRSTQIGRLLSTPEGVDELLGRRFMQPWLADIARFAGRGPDSNPAAVLGLLEFTGISNRGMSEIVSGTVDPMVVLRREMTDGLMTPTLTGGLRYRNSAQWVARMAQTGDSRIGQYLRTIRAQLSTARSVSLSPTRYRSSMTEHLIARSVTGKWADDPQLFRKWAEELLALSDPEESVAKSWYALRAEQASERLARHEAAGKSAGYLRFSGAQSKIAAHEDRLAALDEMIGAVRGEAPQRAALEAEARQIDEALLLADDPAALPDAWLDDQWLKATEATTALLESTPTLTPEQVVAQGRRVTTQLRHRLAEHNVLDRVDSVLDDFDATITALGKETNPIVAERIGDALESLLDDLGDALNLADADTRLAAVPGMMARKEAIAKELSEGPLSRYARDAEARYLRDKSPFSKAKWDDAVEGLNASDPLTALERRAGLLRNSDDTYRELSRQIEQLRIAREQAIRAGGGGKEMLEERINALVAQRRALKAEVKGLGPRVPKVFLSSDPGHAAFRAGYDKWLADKQILNRAWDDLKVAVRRLDIPGSRLAQEDFARRFWEDWGREVFDESESAFKDLPWEKVSGRQPSRQVPAVLGEELGSVTTLDPAAAQRLLGPSVRGIFQAPASPMEMVAYQSRANDGWWARFMIPNQDRHNIWSRFLDATKTAFALNVLANPFTWIRSNLDEPIRYVAQRGLRGRPSEAVPGARIAAPPMAGVRRLQASFPEQMFPEAWRITQDEIMRAYSSIGIKPFGEMGEATVWVSRSRELAIDGADYAGRAAFMDAAHNLFNGVLPSQPMWRAYGATRHLDDPEAWRRFWEDGGGRLIGGTTGDLLGKGPYTGLTATQALAGMDEVVEFFARQTGASADAFRRAFWRKLATGDDIPDSLLRQLQRVPPARPSRGGPIDAAFDVLFGRPAEVMGSGVYRDFYDQAYGILADRHAGKLLTAEVLAARTRRPVEMAEAMLWNGSEYVDDLVRNQGFFTPKMLHVEASRIARVHADHMAYSMAAQTLAQQRLSQMFPFLRAQLDFLGYYKTELVNGGMLGLNPRIAAGLKKLGLRGAERTFDVPLNVRLASRMADYAGTLTTLPELEPGERPQDIFQRIIDQWTFLPSRYDEYLWVQILPGMAPIPSWLLHGLPLEGEGALPAIRDLVEAIYPTFDFQDTRATVDWRDPVGSVRSFANYVFPDSRVSLRRVLGRGATALVTNLLPGTPAADLFNSPAHPPPGFVTQVRRQLIDDLRENPARDINSTPYDKWLEGRINDAWKSTTTANFTRTLTDLDPTGIAGSFLIDSDDGEYLDAYQGMYGALSDMHAMGLVGDPQRDRITDLWAHYQSGEITYREALTLADTFSAILWDLPDTYRDYLVVTNPELAINLISTWQVTENVPGDVAQYVRGDRLVTVPGEQGRELRERGKREGWLVRRPPEDWYDATYTRYAQAVRGLRNFIWTQATGNSWTSRPGDRQELVSVTGRGAQALQALTGDDTAGGWYTRGNLNDLLRHLAQPYAGNTGYGGSSSPVGLTVEMDDYLRNTARDAGEAGFVPDEPQDWPAEVLANVRARFATEIDAQRIDPADYTRYFAPLYGALDYTPPVPPPLESIPLGIEDNTYRFTVPAPLVEVIDGDTVALEYGAPTELGRQRIRLVGINSAEVNTAQADYYLQAGQETPWDAQRRMLAEIIGNAKTVDFVVFDASRFPTLQEVEGDEVRWLMVAYVDGVPLWDERIFSFENPTGAGVGGQGVPPDLYERLTGR